MNRATVLLLILLTVVCTVNAENYWQQDVDYTLTVELNSSDRTISGKMSLLYTNNSPDELDHLFFRLAPNAMRPGSPLHLKELSAGRSRIDEADSSEYGFCVLHSVTDEFNDNLETEIDYSIARVNLKNPLNPGESRRFQFDFTTRLPSPDLAYRFAFINGSFKAAHWYPQACVYDRVLGWVNNQYIGWGENYGETGRYDVSITAPSEYIIAASGVLQNPEQVLPDTLREILDRKNFIDGAEKPSLDFMKGGSKTWRFVGENICDFAFNADKNYCLDEADYDGIKVIAYIHRENADEWHDAAEIGRNGIQFYSETFGRYAYPQMSITDSWGGMEFPMLVMCSGYSPEYYLLFWHEIAHNYFMGAVASNQTDRAFLDEGFTTFMELAAMENFLGREDNLNRKDTWYKQKFYPFDEDRLHRGFRPYMLPAIQGYTKPMPMNADSESQWWIYRASSYYKPVCMLFSLEYMLGRDEMLKCIREYYEHWQFKHPYETDMINSFEETSGKELTYILEQWIYTDKKLDYAVLKPKFIDISADYYKYRIKVKRIGELKMPIGVHVTLDDGTMVKYWLPVNDNPAPPGYIGLEVWDQFRNPDPVYTFEAELSTKIRYIDLDPESLLADLNPMNNRYPFPKIQSDWLVEKNFPPVDAYQIRDMPLLGFNNVDGLKLGWRSKGGYLDYLECYDFSLKFGLLDFTPDVSFEYDTPLKSISPQARIKFDAFDRNGYQGAGLSFSYVDKPKYLSDPVGGFSFGVQHRQHYNDDYIYQPNVWYLDRGFDNTIDFRYWRNLTSSGNTRFELKSSTSAFTEDFNYSRVEGGLTNSLCLWRGLGLNLDIGAGIVRGDAIPRQRLFYSSGWDPEVERSYEYLGINGVIPQDDKQYFAVRTHPGLYSNIGIADGRTGFLAGNSELTIPSSFKYKFWLPFYGDISPELSPVFFANLSVFSDNSVSQVDEVYEVGYGLTLKGIPGGTFRLAFPVWVDPAPVDEDSYAFRWFVSFTPEFKSL